MTTEAWRSRPVFISSTFRDMQAERDHLREHVFPRLEEKLRENRHHLEPIDLRQGVETADAATEAARELLVLKVCLDEIKRSRPFLIVLLGDRYGWVPPDDRMIVAAQEARFQTDLTGKSVTALEIEFGILKEDPDQRRRSFFFFREPLPCDDPDYNDACSPDPQVRARHDKLVALKERLAKDPELGERVHTYRAGWDAQQKRVTGLEDWGNQVFDLLWKDLEQETRAFANQPPPTWEEAERQALAEFVEHRTRGFVGREDITRQLLELARSPQSGAGFQPANAATPWAACVTGLPGSGKSALFAHLHRQLLPSTLNSQPSTLLLANAAGISTRSASVDAMLRRWIQELADFLQIANPLPEKASAEDVENTFAALLGRAAQQRRVVVLLDALNQFEPTVRARHLTWLKPKSWPSNARLIATSLPGPHAEALLAKRTFGDPASAGPGFGVPALADPAGSDLGAPTADSDRLKAGLQTSASQCGVVELALPPLTEADAEQIAKKVWERYHRQFNREVFRVLADKRLPDGTSPNSSVPNPA